MIEKYGKIVSTLCFVRDGQKVLLIHRKKLDSHHDSTTYRALGGKAEQGETPVECVIREVKEESGLTVQPVWKGIITFSTKDEVDWESHVFTSEKFDGILTPSVEGDLTWIDIKELENLPMPEGDKKFIPLIFEDFKFSAQLVYEDGKLKKFDWIKL